MSILDQAKRELEETERAADRVDEKHKPKGEAIEFPRPSPFHQPVATGPLLDDIRSRFRQHVVLPPNSDVALTLWVCFSWVYNHFDACPRCAIVSPTKRCGKTTLLELMSRLCHRPLPIASTSSAALFRAIEEWGPTVMLDEADTFLRTKRGDENDMLRGIINSGFTRTTAKVLRTVGEGKNMRPCFFSTYAPIAIAMIGKPPETVWDRSVIVPMKRRRSDEPIQSMRGVSFSLIQQKLVRWSDDLGKTAGEVRPAIPGGLHDRAADLWEPLLAIAELAGGHWPVTAQNAAVALCAANDEETRSLMLLADIRRIFDSHGQDRIFKSNIIERLNGDEFRDRGWSDLNRGRGVTDALLTKMLREYEVTARQIRIGQQTKKGFLQSDFSDAWLRYLPTPPCTTETMKQPSNDGASGVSQSFSRFDASETDVSADMKHETPSETLQASGDGGCFDVSAFHGDPRDSDDREVEI